MDFRQPVAGGESVGLDRFDAVGNEYLFDKITLQKGARADLFDGNAAEHRRDFRFRQETVTVSGDDGETVSFFKNKWDSAGFPRIGENREKTACFLVLPLFSHVITPFLFYDISIA